MTSFMKTWVLFRRQQQIMTGHGLSSSTPAGMFYVTCNEASYLLNLASVAFLRMDLCVASKPMVSFQSICFQDFLLDFWPGREHARSREARWVLTLLHHKGTEGPGQVTLFGWPSTSFPPLWGEKYPKELTGESDVRGAGPQTLLHLERRPRTSANIPFPRFLVHARSTLDKKVAEVLSRSIHSQWDRKVSMEYA